MTYRTHKERQQGIMLATIAAALIIAAATAFLSITSADAGARCSLTHSATVCAYTLR